MIPIKKKCPKHSCKTRVSKKDFCCASCWWELPVAIRVAIRLSGKDGRPDTDFNDAELARQTHRAVRYWETGVDTEQMESYPVQRMEARRA